MHENGGETEAAQGNLAPPGAGSPGSRTPRKVIVIFTLLVGVSLIVMGLVRKSCEVDINLKVSQVSFKVSDERGETLFNSVTARLLAVSAFKEITLGAGALDITDEVDERTGRPVNWRRVNRPATQKYVLMPQGTASAVTFEAVALNGLDVPVGATARFYWLEDEPNSLKLRFDRAVSGEISGERTLSFSCNGCRLQDEPSAQTAPSLHFRLTGQRDGGNTIYFTGGDSATVIGLALPPETKLKAQNIKLDDSINFTRSEKGRNVSTVMGGEFKFKGVGEEVTLAEGVFVTLGDMEEATLRTISVDNGINLTLHGRVGKLMTGDEGAMQTLNPSVLEWVAARHKWILIIQALMVIVPAFIGLLRWWKEDPLKGG